MKLELMLPHRLVFHYWFRLELAVFSLKEGIELGSDNYRVKLNILCFNMDSCQRLPREKLLEKGLRNQAGSSSFSFDMFFFSYFISLFLHSHACLRDKPMELIVNK